MCRWTEDTFQSRWAILFMLHISSVCFLIYLMMYCQLYNLYLNEWHCKYERNGQNPNIMQQFVAVD